MAQLAEQLICNQQVIGSSPIIGFKLNIAGWSSLEARRAHNPKVAGSNPAPATRTFYVLNAQIAQLVEQRTENPRVAGSIPALGTFPFKYTIILLSSRITTFRSDSLFLIYEGMSHGKDILSDGKECLRKGFLTQGITGGPNAGTEKRCFVYNAPDAGK